MMKWTFLTGLFILATSSGFAQDEESLERWIPYSNTSSIGANAGFTTGVGFSFRHFHNK